MAFREPDFGKATLIRELFSALGRRPGQAMETGVSMSSTEKNLRTCLAVVLAAGEGTRMKSSRPKVLHEIGGRPMLAHVLANLAEAGADAVAVVVGPGREDVADAARKASPGAEIFVQAERLGTAHAVLAARDAVARGYDDVVVLFADTPLVTPATLGALRAALADGAALAALGFEPQDPNGYGRLLVDNG